MKLNELKPAPGSKKSRRRVGRGLGSGRGKTAGRGQKGQSSRSGFSQGAGWEGGRSRLIMRLPKRGFNKVKLVFQIVNLRDLAVFQEGSSIDAIDLAAAGLVRHAGRPIKLLGDGPLEVNGLTIEVDAASQGAINAVTASGGSVIVPVLEEEAAEEAVSSAADAVEDQADSSSQSDDESAVDGTETA